MKFSKTLHVASSDIITYKVCFKKKPNRFNNYICGKMRSFEDSDKYHDFTIGQEKHIELNNYIPYFEYDNEIKEWHQTFKTTGFHSCKTKYKCNESPFYFVCICKCIIPNGAKYYISEDLSCFLSEKIIITEILEQY